MAADGSSEAAGQHGSHARLGHVTLQGVPKATNVHREFNYKILTYRVYRSLLATNNEVNSQRKQ